MATSASELAELLNSNATDVLQIADALNDFFGERYAEDDSESSDGKDDIFLSF